MALVLRLVFSFFLHLAPIISRWLIIDHKQIPRHPPDRGRSEYGSNGRSANLERTYYIVPPGMNVIFRDEYGNELKRLSRLIFLPLAGADHDNSLQRRRLWCQCRPL